MDEYGTPKCTMFQLRYMCELKRGYLHENLHMPFIMAVFQFKEASNPTQPIEVANN